MNRYLILATISVCFASTSLAHESDTITPTGFECQMEIVGGYVVGSGNCVKGDRVLLEPPFNRDRVSNYDYCNLNSIKQTLEMNRKGQLSEGWSWCLYSPKIKKRNAES